MKEKETKPQQEATQQAKSKESFIGTSNGLSLRSRTSSWFECKVRYHQMQQDCSDKVVTELYVVDALSFSEAEASIIGNMADYVSDMKVANINPTNYSEIFFSDVPVDSLWFKARVAFITMDEKSCKEKRTYTHYLIQANSIECAKRYIDEVMGKTMIDYELKSLSETKILDVFEHHASPAVSKEEMVATENK